MRRKRRPLGGIAALGLATWLGLAGARAAWAHCDTMDGPVVTTARAALAKGDVAPALRWVKPEHESEVRAAFRRAAAVRRRGPEARELADRYFFETLVRLHRAGEGAPYTGIQPAGSEREPAVAAADRALETGSIDPLVKRVTDAAADGIRRRFARAAEARKHADQSVAAGRRYVEAYVDFVHYVERLHLDAASTAHHAEQAAETAAGGHDHP